MEAINPKINHTHYSRTIDKLLFHLQHPLLKNLSQKSEISTIKIKQQLRQSFRVHWKTPGQTGQLNPFVAYKGKVLDSWQISRIGLSERSYKDPKNYKGLKTDRFSRLFSQNQKQQRGKLYSRQFNKKLQQVQKKFQDSQFTAKKSELSSLRKVHSQYKMKEVQPKMKFAYEKNKLFGFKQSKTNNKPASAILLRLA